MLDRQADPRTEDVLVYELLSTPRGADAPQVIGSATFRGGVTNIDAPEAVRLAVEELLSRVFVDRVQADERPRGYRRSGKGIVDMLVPGMAEHFIARLRGLWLSYPDGSVVTARAATELAPTAPEAADTRSAVSDPAVRRSSLATAERLLGKGPLASAHAPSTGLRPPSEVAASGPIGRTDCGWLV